MGLYQLYAELLGTCWQCGADNAAGHCDAYGMCEILHVAFTVHHVHVISDDRRALLMWKHG